MSVRIRMKKLGRRHRPFFRICAMDSHAPRNGRVLEELGTYDPMIPEVDARAVLNGERIKYWLSVGALPSEKVNALIRKYGPEGSRLDEHKLALDRLAQGRRRYRTPSHEEAAQEAETEEQAEQQAPAADTEQQPEENTE